MSSFTVPAPAQEIRHYQPQLLVLKAKLRGFEIAKRTFMAHLRKVPKDKRGTLSRLYSAKALLRSQNRHHLVAYGLLRGIPYEQIERCHPQNKPDTKLVFDIMQATSRWLWKSQGCCWQHYDFDNVKELLAPKMVPVSVTSPTLPVPGFFRRLFSTAQVAQNKPE